MVIPESARPSGYRTPRRVPRRPILLALATALTAPIAGLLGGCGQGEPDPLEALAARAMQDAALIDAVLALPGAPADLAGRLAPVADARRQHAQALAVELGETEPSSSAPAPAPPASASPLDVPDTLRRVRAMLESAQRQAAVLVPTLPRARAALVGSIAACCAAHRAVLG